MNFFFRLVVVFAVLSAALAGKAASVVVKDKNLIEKGTELVSTLTKGHSLKAEVKGTETNGLEGLNLKLNAPFKFMDYVVGVKATIGDLKKLSPDTLFVRRTMDVADGKLAVDVDYSLADKEFDVDANWKGQGVVFSAAGNSNDFLTKVAATTTSSFDGASRAIKTTVGAAYELLTHKTSLDGRVESGDAAAEIAYDTKSEDPVLKVMYTYNKHTVKPKISLKSGDVTYGYSRKGANGSIDTTLKLGENVVVEWTDNSSSGAWKTTVDMPLEDSKKTKVSFARDWTL